MVRDDFAVMIISHGRPHKVVCVNTLKKVGYTGKYYIVIDNEDNTADEYYKLYGDKVIMFDKSSMDGTFDIMDNFTGRSVPVFVRNALYDIAKGLGLKYFLELEDDTKEFCHRFVKDNILKSCDIKDFDSIVNSVLDWLDTTNIDTMAFIQAATI